MKTYAIVPVNELDKAKSRLSNYLTSGERKGLLLAMLDDILSALDNLSVIVISPEDITSHLKDSDTVFLLQEGSRNLNDAVIQANNFAFENCAEATLFVPADMPLITEKDMAEVLRIGEDFSAVITHAIDGGTGVLYRRPPDVMDSRFTDNSFQDHLQEARARNIEIKVHSSFSLSLDLDILEDVRLFMKHGAGTKTYEYLSGCGF